MNRLKKIAKNRKNEDKSWLIDILDSKEWKQKIKNISGIYDVDQDDVFYSDVKKQVISKSTQRNMVKNSKKFTVNGGIQPWESVFYISPKEDNHKLIEHIEEGSYLLLKGPRGIGKTTSCLYAARHQLDDYIVLFISMQAAIEFKNKRKFWKSFGSRINEKMDTNITMKSKNDFLTFLSKKGNHFSKPLVLFLDEFDLFLADATNEIKNEFLYALRAIKTDRDDQYNLQAVVAIGPFSILQAADKSLHLVSPFNVTDVIDSKPFTESQIEELFQEFMDTKNCNIEKGIISDIHEKTSGHRGLVCCCGKYIAETLLRGTNTLKYSTWVQNTVHLYKIVNKWATMGVLAKSIEQHPDVFAFAMDYFISNDDTPISFDKSQKPYLDFLLAEGIIQEVLNDEDNDIKYKITCPIIKYILLMCADLRSNIKTDEIRVPIENGGQLDVVKMIYRILPYFDKERIEKAIQWCYKENRTPGVPRGKHVPKENYYHVELLTLLRSWLPPTWLTLSEVNADNKRVDIQISNTTNDKWVLELVAHATKDDILEHIQRAQKYKRILKAKQSWVLNFTILENESQYIWSTEEEIQIIHIYHDINWSKAKIVYKLKNENPTSKKINLNGTTGTKLKKIFRQFQRRN